MRHDPSGRPLRVTLVGKPGCHLCDDARAVVQRVAGELGVGWEERSVLDDAALHEAYWDRIPVTLVDGRVHEVYRVDPERLRRALRG
ncbi:glutaredoxin family protein [Vallicoccus soli]|uniref:Glutaredoxin family protein n=1 Tax=Vallicoccus soli TaxID=2339232 RepID=A0A3A3YX66_9ACTN|nr:glutaredoxin family protein [Vallicoccus soli]